jgi:hypothetical protein
MKEKPSYVVMLQNEGFVAPNKRMMPHIKKKKCTKKTYSLMHLIFNSKKKEKLKSKRERSKNRERRRPTVGLGLASH